MRRLVYGILIGAVLAASVAGARGEAETASLPVLHTTLRLARDKYVEPAQSCQASCSWER